MDVVRCAIVSAILIACPSATPRKAQDAGHENASQTLAGKSGPKEEARQVSPPPPSSPLASELEQLRRALVARDVDKLEQMLSPDGVLCGDYLYGSKEYASLVRQPGGALRPWLFGDPLKDKPSVRTYLETAIPSVQEDSPTHRTAVFATSTGSVDIGFTLRNGKWLISDGLFC